MFNHLLEISALVVLAAVIVAIAYEGFTHKAEVDDYYNIFDEDLAVLHTKVEPVIKAAEPIAIAVQDNAGNVADAAAAALIPAAAPAASVSGQAMPPATTADVAGSQPAKVQ